MSLTEAEGLADLELWEEAGKVLEELPPEERTAPEVIRLRLECAIGMERWNMVMELAGHLAKGSNDDRRVAAVAYRVLAGVATRSRQIETAKTLLRSAIEAWPEVRREIDDDPELSEHLR